MSQNNVNYRKLALDLLKSIGVFYILYFLSVNLIGAFLEDEKDAGVIKVVLTVIFYIIYAVSFYFIHARKSADDYSMNVGDGKYSFKEDLIAVMKGEGKALAIIYGVCAVLYTIATLVPFLGFICVILMPIFPLYIIFSVPVASGLIGWLAVTALSVLAILISHARVHRLVRKGKV